MKKMRYILGLGVMLLSALSCTKESGPEAGSDELIAVGAQVAETKAIIEGETFPDKSVITVYDWFAEANKYHMNGVYAQYTGNATWTYVELKNSLWANSSAQYHWEEGTHKFFGWLQWDGSMYVDDKYLTPEEFFGNGFSFDNQKLSIGSKTMNQNTAQYDFVYSDIKTVEYSKGNNPGRVDLKMSHLFTAFSVAAQNMSASNKITVQSISIEGLNTTNTATIDFSGNATSVTYGAGSNDDAAVPDYTFNPQMLLGTNLFDMSSKTDASQSREYFLTWPMSAEKAATVRLTVNYKVNNEANIITKTVNLNAKAWEAGKKNNLNLVFKDKEIVLECIVMDWFVYDEQIDFSDQVSVSTTMTWENVRSVNYQTGEVILFDDVNTPATCKFHIRTPKGATWTASIIPVEGHQDAFSFIEETKYGAVGGEESAFFKLVVNNQAPIAPRHVCIIRVTVQTSDGRTIVVKNLVPTTWVDENGVSHPTNGYEEFRIVQNLING